uniref:U39-Austrotoxin-Ht1n_2 n=1 Tax=Hickmania troglodytes TaxID=489260 RepID=A0A482Z5F7_9ARAC
MNFAIVLLVVVASASALNIKDSLNEEAKSLIAEGVADALMKHVSTIEEDDVSHYVEEPEIPSWLEKQVKDHVQDFSSYTRSHVRKRCRAPRYGPSTD